MMLTYHYGQIHTGGCNQNRQGRALTSMNISGSLENRTDFNLESIVYFSILRTLLIFMKLLETSKNNSYHNLYDHGNVPQSTSLDKKSATHHNCDVIESRIICPSDNLIAVHLSDISEDIRIYACIKSSRCDDKMCTY